MLSLPRYNLAWILRRKDELLDDADLRMFLGQTIRRLTWSELSQTLEDKLRGRVPLPVIRDSLRYLAGQRLHEEELELLLWRLLGNLERLRSGHPVLPWQLGGAVAEWVPVQLGDSRPLRKARKPGVVMEFTILAGLPSGLVTSRRVSYGMAGMLASRLGFSRPRGPFPYRQVQQLFGLRTYALISPERSRETPYLEQFHERPAFATWNKRLLRLRRRTAPGGHTCPRRLPPSLDCHRCPAGLDACPIACRSQTWQRKVCWECERECWLPADEDCCPGCAGAD